MAVDKLGSGVVNKVDWGGGRVKERLRVYGGK